MSEIRRPTQSALAVSVLIALVSIAVCALGGVAALLGGWLAQPALALAVRAWRGASMQNWREYAASVLGIWAAGFAGLALLLWWPLNAAHRGGGVGPLVAAGAVVLLVWLVLWRTWPLWYWILRDGGSISRRWHALGENSLGSGRGLGVAAAILVLLIWPLALAWPDLLSQPIRLGLTGVALLVWPLLHLWVQRTRAPAPALLPIAEAGELNRVAAPTAAAADEDPDPDVALYAAARSGRVDRALQLLEDGADPRALPPAGDRDRRALPVLAAVLPDLRLLRALIARGIDLNPQTGTGADAGMAPLLAATRDSWHGRPDAVMTLLANGADPRACDAEGNTALHHAARSSDPAVAALLRDAAADLDARNHDGITALGVACAAGNWRLARFLLEHGAKPEVEGGSPALLAAAGGEENDAAGVQLLLKHKAKIAARDTQGRSALHEAAQAGHVDILAALLEAGADVHARDLAGRTPLLDAAYAGRLGAVNALLAAAADVNVRDAQDRTALALACAGLTPSAALVRCLLERGADPDAADATGRRAVDLAAEAGRWSLVTALDPNYPLPVSVRGDESGQAATGGIVPGVQDRPPAALLAEALELGSFEALDPALARLLTARELGALLGQQAALSWPAGIEWLLRHGADADVVDAHGNSPVFRLLDRPDALTSLQTLLRMGAAPAGSGGLARFLAARIDVEQTTVGVEQMALELLERGADPFVPSPGGDPPLTLAVRLGWSNLVERLMDCGVDIDAHDSHGMSALHLAAALGRESLLRLLVAHGANPELRAGDGQTPLGVALSARRRDLADWLDWRGWPLPRRRLQPTDLPAAAIVGDVDAVRRLLDLGFPVDTPDAQGCSALLRAAGGGHRALVDLLLARGADPQCAAHTGATPLSAAVSMRQGEIVERLLQAGAVLEHRLPGEVSVLMLAAALGLPDLCARLLNAGADIHARDAQGLTPLHCAALYGFSSRDRQCLVALLDTLLQAGAAPDAAAAGAVTPLLLLLGARAGPGTATDEDVVLAGLGRLLGQEIGLHARDPRGFGPLHLSALHGLLRVTRYLLSAGADPDLRDGLNRTPREIAVMRGFVDVAAELALDVTGGVATARFMREPQ